MTARTHGRSGRPWRRLRAQVLREEPYCQIRGPKCKGVSTTVDHVVPLSIAPQLAHERTNLRGACAACNCRGGARITNSRRKRTATPPLTCACWPHCGGVHWSRDWDAPYKPSEDW